ncbi:MAG: large-conductance mechanosensitive channel protein MscL [Negativicutes bacterium]|nr:large-conductance mechanosensitive channel protein MscL [Negativicutes bacterium]
MISEFKKFIMRGNVIDLAVGVIIGGAFGKIVTSLVNDIVMPLLSVILGRINLAGLKVIINPASATSGEVALKYGAFLQSVIDFLIVALAIFLMIKLLSSFKKKEKAAPVIPPAPSKEEVLLAEIRDLLQAKSQS